MTQFRKGTIGAAPLLPYTPGRPQATLQEAMPTSVAASKQAPPAAAAAAAGSPRGDNTLTDADAASALPHSHRPPDDALALAPLADRYTSALFTYPADDPTPRMKAGYAAQRSAKQKLDVARSQREGLEASLAEKLGRLHNLLRESREREARATKMLRKKTVEVYEAELEEPPSNSDFKAKLVQLTSYVKKHRSPPTLAELEAAGNADPQTKELARFVVQTVNSGVPHHLAALANLGVPIPSSEEDAWHRSLRQFQRHSREYWDNPLLVKATNGDVVKSIREFTYGGDERGAALKAWCAEQQEAFEEGTLTAGSERFDKLADAGFTFDVVVDDKEWEERVEWVKEFHGKFGHVHIPEGYVPPSLLPEAAAASSPDLKEFAARIRAVVHRDALAPARASHLKTSGLHLDLGGRAYDYHVQYCKVGRGARGEEQRTKRKFAVLEDIGEDGEIGNSRKVRRNNMNNWIEKLESEFCVHSIFASMSDEFTAHNLFISRTGRPHRKERHRPRPKRRQAEPLDVLPHSQAVHQQRQPPGAKDAAPRKSRGIEGGVAAEGKRRGGRGGGQGTEGRLRGEKGKAECGGNGRGIDGGGAPGAAEGRVGGGVHGVGVGGSDGGLRSRQCTRLFMFHIHLL